MKTKEQPATMKKNTAGLNEPIWDSRNADEPATSSAIQKREINKFTDQLMFTLSRRAETWRTNTNDPHNINTAVYVALAEVGQAIADARAQLFMEQKPKEQGSGT